MIVHPAVIVHGVEDCRAALSLGLPVTLLSAPGAGSFAGCLWWREVVAAVRTIHPDTVRIDVLDCADASGMALAALRGGVCRLVLWPGGPGWAAVAMSAHLQGGFVLQRAPAALDMASHNAARQLRAWLRGPGAPGA